MSEKKDDKELVEFTYKGVARKGYPEVAAYLNHRRQGDRDYADIRAEADYEYRKAERQLARNAEDEGRELDTYRNLSDQAAYEEIRRERQAKYDQANAAREGVEQRRALEQSSHKEVAFIARKALFARQGDEVEGYARDILAILPATTQEIWAEAKDNRGMCDAFDRFYDEADAEGVFADGEKLPGRRELAALRSYIRRNYGSDYVRVFMEKTDPILKAYEDDYQAKLAAAKAEWQGLDEAWRSERSRRGAATRAANHETVAHPSPDSPALSTPNHMGAQREERETVAVNGNHPDVTMENDAVLTISPAYANLINGTATIPALTPERLESFESVSETEEKVSA